MPLFEHLFCCTVPLTPVSRVIVPLCIYVVMLDKAVVIVYRLREGTSAVRRALSCAPCSSLLRNGVTRIDPVGIDVDRGRQVYKQSAPPNARATRPTYN